MPYNNRIGLYSTVSRKSTKKKYQLLPYHIVQCIHEPIFMHNTFIYTAINLNKQNDYDYDVRELSKVNNQKHSVTGIT